MHFNSSWLVCHFTARKRSLGQSNFFTGVCLSTGGWGWQTPPRETPPRQTHPRADTPPPDRHPLQETATEAGGTHPTGMHSFSEVFRLYQVSVIDVHCNIIGVGVELVCSKCANHNLPGKRIAGHNMTLT